MHLYAAAIVIIIAIAALLIRDFGIQESQDNYASLLRQYESQVANAGNQLDQYEKKNVDTSILDTIAAKQQSTCETANTLISLDLPDEGSIDSYNESEVNQYNEKVDIYNTSISLYTTEMSDLNKIVTSANKQYSSIVEFVPIEPFEATYKPEKKVFEILGIQKMPEIAFPEKANEINATVSERYEHARAIREQWNSKAAAIDKDQVKINDLLDQLYSMYGTNSGVRIEDTNMVKTY